MIMVRILRAHIASVLVLGITIAGLFMAPARASEVQAGNLRIHGLQVSVLPRAARNAAVFMTIVNDGPVPDRLVGVTTTRSRIAPSWTCLSITR